MHGKAVIKMAKHTDYEKRTEKLLEPLLKKHSFELYDVEYVKEGGSYYLRVYIDKENGITIDDCELVSRALSDMLDEADFIPDSYILEVSSPGLGRQLKKDKHFDKSIGEEVEIKLYKPLNKKKEWVGILEGYNAYTISIRLEDNSVVDFKRTDIAMIRLTFDF